MNPKKQSKTKKRPSKLLQSLFDPLNFTSTNFLFSNLQCCNNLYVIIVLVQFCVMNDYIFNLKANLNSITSRVTWRECEILAHRFETPN